jgi:hypothetical protein
MIKKECTVEYRNTKNPMGAIIGKVVGFSKKYNRYLVKTKNGHTWLLSEESLEVISE